MRLAEKNRQFEENLRLRAQKDTEEMLKGIEERFAQDQIKDEKKTAQVKSVRHPDVDLIPDRTPAQSVPLVNNRYEIIQDTPGYTNNQRIADPIGTDSVRAPKHITDEINRNYTNLNKEVKDLGQDYHKSVSKLNNPTSIWSPNNRRNLAIGAGLGVGALGLGIGAKYLWDANNNKDNNMSNTNFNYMCNVINFGFVPFLDKDNKY